MTEGYVHRAGSGECTAGCATAKLLAHHRCGHIGSAFRTGQYGSVRELVCFLAGERMRAVEGDGWTGHICEGLLNGVW